MKQILEADNLYDVLGISREASESDVERAYRRLSLQVHPDKVGSEGHPAFLRLSKARDVMLNPQLRHIYDTEGEKGLPTSADAEESMARSAETFCYDIIFGPANTIPYKFLLLMLGFTMCVLAF
eukprot:PhF_6_TR41623/c0_g1_i2/m.63087